ncbi:MAG: AI-2E family transporter [Phototrophicaceae bacterium]|jgi:predicted PurR-regulated permease PerM
MSQNTNSSPSPSWNLELKRIIGVIAFVIIALLIWQFRGVLPLVFTAIVLAYLLNPVANFIQRRFFDGRMRGLAVVFTFLGFVLLLILAILFVVPALVEQIQAVISGIPNFLRTLQETILTQLQNQIDLTGTPLERFLPEPTTVAQLIGVQLNEGETLEVFDLLVSQVSNFDAVAIAQQLGSSITSLGGSAFSVLGGALSFTLNFIFLLTMTFYLMGDGTTLVNAIERGMPEGYQSDFRRLLRELGNVWNAYLRGQLVLALIMGSLMFLLASILGIPNAIFLGIFAGLMEFIPNVGPTLAMVPAAGVALFAESATIPGLSGFFLAISVVIGWTILQQIEAAVLVPRIVGDSLNLHPFVVMVAVLAGLSIGGIFAVLIAAPLVASLRLIAQYIYGKLFDRELFPVDRRTVEDQRRARRPILVRLADISAQRARNLLSDRSITKRNG